MFQLINEIFSAYQKLVQSAKAVRVEDFLKKNT